MREFLNRRGMESLTARDWMKAGMLLSEHMVQENSGISLPLKEALTKGFENLFASRKHQR